MKGFGKGGKSLGSKAAPQMNPGKSGTAAKGKGGFMPFKKGGKK